MVSGAALLGAPFLQRDIFTANADVELVAFTIRSGQFRRSYSQYNDPVRPRADTASDDRLHTDDGCHIPMPGLGQNFIRYAFLQNSALAHDDHSVSHSERVDPVVSYHDGGHFE